MECVAAYFIRRSGKDTAKVVADLAKTLKLATNEEAKALITTRIRPFVDTVLPRHTIKISMGDLEPQTLGPSSASGMSSAIHDLPMTDHPTASTIESKALGVPSDDQSFVSGDTIFAEPTGWGVISDIDDTIKVTMTHTAIGILQKTFTEPLQPVDGMPELYKEITTKYNNPCTFYLSASPYNLYHLLRTFRQQYYPPGTLILRDASWQNLGGLIASLSQNVQAYKVDRIDKIHSWFPSRKFICFGDSTQKDPESYGEAARKYPGWIKGIFIRRVAGVSEVTDPDEVKKNEDLRFEKAFKDLDRELWMVFDSPDEVRSKLDAIVAAGL